MKKIYIFSLGLTLLLLAVSYEPIYAEVKLPSIFCDNMVLQQQSNVAIWGWAKAGSSISVIPSWDGKKHNYNLYENQDTLF